METLILMYESVETATHLFAEDIPHTSMPTQSPRILNARNFTFLSYMIKKCDNKNKHKLLHTTVVQILVNRAPLQQDTHNLVDRLLLLKMNKQEKERNITINNYKISIFKYNDVTIFL